MNVKCPTCKKPSSFLPTNSFRPFCSERCQTLDLGAWADEQYRVPIEQSAVDNENLSVNSTVNEISDPQGVSSETPPRKDLLN